MGLVVVVVRVLAEDDDLDLVEGSVSGPGRVRIQSALPMLTLYVLSVSEGIAGIP